MQYFYSACVILRSSECAGGSAGSQSRCPVADVHARAWEGFLGVEGLEGGVCPSGARLGVPLCWPGGCRCLLWACAKVDFV